jgi:hypothetical protein
MEFWNKIKRRFYHAELLNRLKDIKPARSVISLSDARSIGVLYDSTNPDNDIVITRFAETLRRQNKSVEILGFINDKKIDHKDDIAIFNKADLNWYEVPRCEKAEKFAAQKFDLLLACFVESNAPLEYISCISASRWRVGVYAGDKTNCYDMMVNIAGRTELPYLLEQIVHFLNRIKQEEHSSFFLKSPYYCGFKLI